MAEKKTAETTTAEGNSMSEDFMSRLLSAAPEDRVRLWLDSGALHDKNNPDSHVSPLQQNPQTLINTRTTPLTYGLPPQ
jgi:hypothetical protein